MDEPTEREQEWLALVLQKVRELEAGGYGSVEVVVHRGSVAKVVVRPPEQRISIDAA